MNSEKLMFLMDVFEKIQELKERNPADENIHLLERRFYKSAGKEMEFQRNVLGQIFEASIEEKINTQCRGFYSHEWFKKIPTDTLGQLKDCYCQMETQRRRDDFERYCQCIFQQIEALVTLLFDTGTPLEDVIKNRKRIVYPKAKNSPTLQSLVFEYSHYPKPPLPRKWFSEEDYDLLFSKEMKPVTEIQIKFRCVLYSIYFNEEINGSWKNVSNSFRELQVIRNLFHKGPIKFTDSQGEKLKKVLNKKYYYYHSFTNLLSDFVYGILESPKLNKLMILL
jgi:hypothetical protein